MVPVLVIVALAAFVLWPWGALAVVALPLAVLAGEAAYRNLGHARHGDFLTARRGALIRTTAIVPAAKTQSARVHSTLFQRRAGLATLHVDVAGGGAMPQVTDEAAATGDDRVGHQTPEPSRSQTCHGGSPEAQRSLRTIASL